jgi:hypothetical protein
MSGRVKACDRGRHALNWPMKDQINFRCPTHEVITAPAAAELMGTSSVIYMPMSNIIITDH